MNPRLIDLLSGTIASVWGVELLLLLHRDQARTWELNELVGELRSSRLVVDQSVDRLERGGLLVRLTENTIEYSPATVELSGLVDQLRDEYRSRPDAVRRAIVSAPDAKLKSFTDAFVLRKPPK